MQALLFKIIIWIFDPGVCEFKASVLNHYATMPSYFRFSDYIKILIATYLCGIGLKVIDFQNSCKFQVIIFKYNLFSLEPSNLGQLNKHILNKYE